MSQILLITILNTKMVKTDDIGRVFMAKNSSKYVWSGAC